MQWNDLDMANWKEYDVNTDSLWLINERDKSGKHKNIYHGNFIPQIPNQLNGYSEIKRDNYQKCRGKSWETWSWWYLEIQGLK